MEKQISLFEKKVEQRNTHLPEIEEGDFVLNGVRIHYVWKKNYFSPDSLPHIDFDSNKIPNAISETGYRSFFLGLGEDLSNYPSVRAIIEGYCLDTTKIKPVFESIQAIEKEVIEFAPIKKRVAILQERNNGFDVLNVDAIRLANRGALAHTGITMLRKEFEKQVKDSYGDVEIEWKELTLDELILDKSKELKDLLKKKYGYDVTIRVLKSEVTK